MASAAPSTTHARPLRGGWIVDALLRGRWSEADRQGPRREPLAALGLVLAFGTLYGAVMGTFGGFSGERLWQVLYSAAKVPLLLLVSFVLSLPTFFVINTLFGLREDFGRSLRALLAAQAVLTVVLASLAPFTALWYLSFDHYRAAILFNGAMFAVASVAAQLALRRSYRPLIARRPRHRTLLRIWLALYVFVAVQMAWVLRPFIGNPTMPTRFFREEAWGNAYVEVARIIAGLLGA